MQDKPARIARLTVSIAGIAALGLCGWGMLSLHAREAEAPNEAAPTLRHEGELLIVPDKSPLRRSLAFADLAEETVAAPFVLPAVVEADPAKLVKVLPPLSGRIVSLDKQLGDEVRAGDVLFTIDSADLAQAVADQGKAQAALGLAEHNLDRQRDLDRSEITSKHDLQQAQSDFEQARSEAARAHARLAQLGAKASAGAPVSTGSHLLAVRSPIAGRVVDLSAAIGGYWNDTTAPIMTVADLSHVFVTASAQEKDIPQIYAGQSATVKLDAYPEPLAAKVRFVGEMLDADTRTLKVRMLFDNRNGRLKPGMFAQATLLMQAHPGVMVPMTAVIQSGFYNRAFVEVAPWKFEARTVRLGAQIGERVEVVAGLKAGERVVAKDGVLLND